MLNLNSMAIALLAEISSLQDQIICIFVAVLCCLIPDYVSVEVAMEKEDAKPRKTPNLPQI